MLKLFFYNFNQFDGRCANNDPHGGLGCNGCGLQTCRYCGHSIYPDCLSQSTTIDPSTSSSSTSSPSSSTTTERPHCECGNAFYDERCSDTNIDGDGCGACGLINCRTQLLTCPCGSSEWDPDCADPGTDQHGGLGCNACGVAQCRLCGHGVYPNCLS